MIFNSIAFLLFFSIFFSFYWFVFNRNLRIQNLFILAGSYFFYAWWDWRFAFLLLGGSLANYLIGKELASTQNNRKKRYLLAMGLIYGIGGLIFFKYFNFFIKSFVDLFLQFNIRLNIHTLNIVLPLGISFYTFRTIGYLLDINNGKIKPVADWVVFFAYVSYFPSLISGPIDKAKMLVPQLEKKRVFDYREATDGMRQILWGLFKKIAIADSCAIFADQIFSGYQNMPGSTLLLGLFFYTIQVYADFSGYSDIAIGISRLLGFRITKNFDFPYFAQNIAEFWRKWHISLTTWLTEYVFTPLSIKFRDLGKTGLFFAILINFLLIGLWHGANWTFILFGLLHGCFYLPLIVRGTINRKIVIAQGKLLPSLREFINVLITFTFVMLTLIIFRANTISEGFHYLKRIFSFSLFSVPAISLRNEGITLLLIGFFFAIEWLGREGNYAIENIGLRWPKVIRWALYYLILALIFIFATSGQYFIYFQF